MDYRLKLMLFFVSSVLVVFKPAMALDVVADSGNTVDAQQFLLGQPDLSHIDIANAKIIANKENLKVENVLYPAISDASSGIFKSKACAKLDTPIFIVGSDDFSIKWLKNNEKYLKKINAYGLITNIKDESEKKRVEAIANTHLMPANNSTLKALGVDTYPVLIKRGECSQ